MLGEVRLELRNLVQDLLELVLEGLVATQDLLLRREFSFLLGWVGEGIPGTVG